MAAKQRISRRRLSGHALAWFIAAPVGITVNYFLAAWLLSAIPRNADWQEPASGVTVMVETNGLHTGIVMPIVSEAFDWRGDFPSAAEPTSTGELPTHISVDWGEREVLLNTPTWSDLRPSTALRILFLGGEAIIRVNHYVRPAPSPYHRPLRLRPEEYRRLVADIRRSLPPLPPGAERRDHRSFQPGTRNYASFGRYTVFNTCNTWVGDRLASAGMRVGAWTPLAGGVMKWVPEP